MRNSEIDCGFLEAFDSRKAGFDEDKYIPVNRNQDEYY